MKIKYPVRSKFLAPCLKVLKEDRNKMLIGGWVSIQLSSRSDGYPGTIQVCIDESNSDDFDTDWTGKDSTRFPVRIRATALALYQCGIFGAYQISHRKGVIEVKKS